MKAADGFYCRLLAAGLLGVASMAVSAAHGVAQDRSAPPITVYPHRAGMSLANADSLIARARERNHLRVIVGTREEMLDEDALEPRQAEAQRARSTRTSKACSPISARGGNRTARSAARAHQPSPCSKASRSWP